MNIVLEEIYNLIEASLIVGLLAFYFGVKTKFDPKLICIASASIVFLFLNILNAFDLSWAATFITYTALITLICRLFYQGSVLEQFMISIITNIFIALINVYSLTLISRLMGTEYRELASQGSQYRFLAVMITKALLIVYICIAVAIKKRTSFMLRKIDCLLITATLTISFLLIFIVRNIVYISENFYDAFFAVILLLLLLNIIQFCIIAYVSKKNIDEQNMSLMKMQLEMQQGSLEALEEKYNETSQLRHDMRNCITIALGMSDKYGDAELTQYLSSLLDKKIDPASKYICTGRKLLDAVLNTKMSVCKNKGFNINCAIMDVMESIEDTDLGILLANLLDNAIEACEKNSGDSEIFLRTKVSAGYYCIEIANTVENDVLSDNPKLLTSKADKSMHGFGLKSVFNIVEKYNGIINYQQKLDKFYVYVSLAKE